MGAATKVGAAGTCGHTPHPVPPSPAELCAAKWQARCGRAFLEGDDFLMPGKGRPSLGMTGPRKIGVYVDPGTAFDVQPATETLASPK
jgi:hypothetical protein